MSMSDTESESTGAKVIFQPLAFQAAMNGLPVGNDHTKEPKPSSNESNVIKYEDEHADMDSSGVSVGKDRENDVIDIKSVERKKRISEENTIEEKPRKVKDDEIITLGSEDEANRPQNMKPSGKVDPNIISDAPIDTDKQTRYRIWKKNTPFLYSILQTSTLLWPSLSVEWFPDIEEDEAVNTQRLLLGSYSSGFNRFESIELCNVSIPSNLDKITLEDCTYDPEREEFFASELPDTGNQQKDESSKCKGALQIVQEIPHEGDINKARLMPQNPDLIATISNSGSVYIFDRTKKPNSFNMDDLNRSIDGEDEEGGMADIQLKFHTTEGWGLDWNRNKEGELVTGSNDGMIAIWNIKKQFQIPEKTTSSLSATRQKKFRTCVLKPVSTQLCHDYGVNSVKYSSFHDALVGTAGEDGVFKLFDTRILNGKPILQSKIGNAINALDFNRKNEFAVALGDDHGNLYISDLRALNTPAKTVTSAHTGAITALEWNHAFGNVIASSSEDSTVRLWRFGASASSKSSNSDLMFSHGGHMLGVSDISWNPADPKMIASCSADNSVHIWKPSSAIF